MFKVIASFALCACLLTASTVGAQQSSKSAPAQPTAPPIPSQHKLDLYSPSRLPKSLSINVGDKVVFTRDPKKLYVAAFFAHARATDGKAGDVLKLQGDTTMIPAENLRVLYVFLAARPGTAVIEVKAGGNVVRSIDVTVH